MPNDERYHGHAARASGNDEINRLDFVIRQVLGKVATTTLVRVEAVTNEGGVSAVGQVDIRPLIAQVDGAGNATAHGTIHDVPYLRVQGGANAIILDPQVGDIGIALFASRDISSVKANKGPANPGSRRKFDMADALYIGGVLNGGPSQYIRFSGDGVEIKAAKIVCLGDVEVTGKVTASGEVTGKGIALSAHVHSGVTSGASTSGPPIP